MDRYAFNPPKGGNPVDGRQVRFDGFIGQGASAMGPQMSNSAFGNTQFGQSAMGNQQAGFGGSGLPQIPLLDASGNIQMFDPSKTQFGGQSYVPYGNQQGGVAQSQFAGTGGAGSLSTSTLPRVSGATGGGTGHSQFDPNSNLSFISRRQSRRLPQHFAEVHRNYAPRLDHLQELASCQLFFSKPYSKYLL